MEVEELRKGFNVIENLFKTENKEIIRINKLFTEIKRPYLLTRSHTIHY